MPTEPTADAVAVSVSLVGALLAAGLSQRTALSLVGMARSTWHYRDNPRPRVTAPLPHTQRRALSWLTDDEQALIIGRLEDGFAQGWSVYQTFYEALDAGHPIASLSSWHRIARAHLAAQRPVRRTRKHRATAMPSLIVDGPMQAWSWDITHLKGPYVRGTYQLYVVLDVFSRMIVTWRLETREDDELAREMFQAAFTRHGARPRIVHSDGGPAMTSNTLTGLFGELGIEVSRNRPRVSNDNPYSEALFKTAKYAPTYPAFFTDIEHARTWVTTFVAWYNHQHHHSGLEGHAPADVHNGAWTERHHQRVITMDRLYAKHPERFRSRPTVKTPMAQVAINHPTTDDRLQTG